MSTQNAGHAGNHTDEEAGHQLNLGAEILFEMRHFRAEVGELRADVKGQLSAQNGMNTEMARMAVKMEMMGGQLASLQDMAARVGRLETQQMEHQRWAERSSEMTKWLVALTVGTFLSLIGLVLNWFKKGG